MPFIRIEVNQDVSQDMIDQSMSQVTDAVHAFKGDPKEMILVVIDTKVNASFGGDYEQPVAMVNIVNLEMTEDVTRVLTEKISDILLENFNVNPKRMYIYFQQVTHMHLFSWDRKTFQDIFGGDTIADAKKRISAVAKK